MQGDISTIYHHYFVLSPFTTILGYFIHCVFTYITYTHPFTRAKNVGYSKLSWWICANFKKDPKRICKILSEESPIYLEALKEREALSLSKMPKNIKYNVGDKIWAKMKGYPHWPARVRTIVDKHL